MNNTSSQFTPQSPPAATATSASPTSSRTRSHFYHSEPLPKSPSQGQFPTDHRHTNSRDSHAVGQPLPPAPQTQLPTQLPKPTRSSIGGISSPGNHLNRHVISNISNNNNNNNSNSNSSSNSASDVDSSAKSNTSADRSSIQFNTSEIEKSYLALIKRQPVGNTGPTVLQGKQRQPSKDIKQRNLLSPNPMSNIHIMQSHSRTPSKTSNPSGSLSHSPIFGSPASEHAKRWVKTVGRDQPSDTESEHPESDQEALEDNQQQQWQIDYENDVAGQVELETETDLPRKQPLAPSSWTNKTHALFNMADPSAPKKQGTYSGGLTSTHPYPVHPLSPSPSFLGPGTSGVPPKSSETPPQKTSQFDISSIPPIPASAVHQPLPPLPPPPTTAPVKPPSRPKQAKHHDSSRRAPKADRPPAPAPPVVERKPLSLTNPPRKCIHHGKILQIINSTTVKDRYLFLFNDILLIVKHMSEGSPTLESRFQVKDVIELKTISISLTRDKYDPKSGLTGTQSNRKISPILAEFIHTFDQEPEEAIRKFVQKRALHPDSTSVAHLLFKTPELSKSQLALFFSRQDKYVYRSFLDQCQFAGVLLDEALRILLTRLCLPDRIGAHRTGGPSERTLNRVDYLLEEFARRWYEANANVIVFDASIAHKLVIAMIVLNAQLHHNEGASIVKDREEVGILIRPRIGSQPSTPTIASVPVMDSNLAVPLTTTAQLYMTLELDDLSAFPRPTKESFVESFQHLDQQRIVPRDILHNIYLSISHQPLDIDSDRLSVSTPNPTSSTGRKLPPIMIFPATLPPRLTLKIASDPITITIPTPNSHFSIHLSGKDLKCEPPVLEFGSHRSQLFRITGLAPGRRTLTIQPRIATDKGTAEQYYDMKNLPYKQTIAIERQFMRHTFQISMLNDLGRRRYLFGVSTAAEKDEWARVLSHYLHMAKGQNAARLNEHTGLEKSIGLQILKELLLGVDASDQDENEDAVEPSETKVPPEPIPEPTPVVPPPTMGLGIPFEGRLSGIVPARSAANAGSSTATTAGHHSPKLGSGANTEWPSAHGSNGTTSSKDSWMCHMPKPGAKVPDRKGSELIQLVEQNSLMELVLGFMRDISRDRVRRMEENEQRMAAKAQVETDEGYEEDEGYDVDDMDEGVEDDEEEEDELAPLASSNVLGSFAAGVTPPVEIYVEQAPETKKRFSGWPRSASMLAAAKKNAGRSPTIPEDQAEKPKEQQDQEKTKVQEQQKCTTSTITEQVEEEEEEEDEEGAVSAVSGKAHMVKGKETWWEH